MSRPAVLSRAPLPLRERVVPPWPGTQVDGLFVRRAPGPAGAEPALFVHGLGGASTNWTDLMALLAHRVDGAAVDLPGFGRSAPAARYALDTHVRAVVQLLERGDGPAHLLGNSLGGAVSTRVAATRPDLVRTLTLVSPALPVRRPGRGGDPRLPLLLVPGLSLLASRALARRPAEQRARAVLELCFADPSRVPEERLREATEEIVRRSGLTWSEDAFSRSLRGLVASYLQVGPQSLWRQAARVAAPTLVVWGAQDRLVPVALAPRAAATIPDARLLVLPGVGHVAQMEEPETVARAVLGLLDEAGAAGAGDVGDAVTVTGTAGP